MTRYINKKLIKDLDITPGRELTAPNFEEAALHETNSPLCPEFPYRRLCGALQWIATGDTGYSICYLHMKWDTALSWKALSGKARSFINHENDRCEKRETK